MDQITPQKIGAKRPHAGRSREELKKAVAASAQDQRTWNPPIRSPGHQKGADQAQAEFESELISFADSVTGGYQAVPSGLRSADSALDAAEAKLNAGDLSEDPSYIFDGYTQPFSTWSAGQKDRMRHLDSRYDALRELALAKEAIGET